MKVCSKCGINKKESAFGKHRDVYKGTVKYYEKSYCISCEQSYQRDWNSKRKSMLPPKPDKPVEVERSCISCGETKLLKDFGKLRAGKYVKRVCKKCLCKRSMAYYEKKKHDSAFKESNRLKASEYYNTNKPVCRERNRSYQGQESYKQRRRERWPVKYKKNKAHILKKSKEYNKRKIGGLSDQYIIIQLEKEGVDRLTARQHPALIEAKRIQLKIKRHINNAN